MALTYNSFVSEIATITVISSTVLVSGDNNFGGIMDAIINQAEGMLWRDLDLPVLSVTDASVVVTSGNHLVQLSTTQGTLLVIQTANLLSTAGVTSSFGNRLPMIPTSRAVIDAIYPSVASSNCGQPQYFNRLSDNELYLGPAPDLPYGLEIVATIRPTALSASNSSTWLTQNVPELMIAAGMVFAAGYMRNYGAQADDPKMAMSWKSQYDTLIQAMKTQAAEMNFESAAWTSQGPSPLATPPRA